MNLINEIQNTSNCIQNNLRILICKEKNKNLTLNCDDAQNTFRIKYDKCLYKGNEKSCDFLVFKRQGNAITKLAFVELKGRKIDEAYDQIMDTYHRLKAANNFNGVVLKAFIVYKRGDSFDKKSRKYKQLKALIGKEDPHSVKVSTSGIEDDF